MFCETNYKTALTPTERAMSQRSESRSCFWRSRSPTKGALTDEDITSIYTINGPITRSRARQLNLQVRSTLVNCVLELTLGAMDVLMIRYLRENQ
jgi:hypothetical protein|uniref:Uncharacterized protein n=1 Tax=Zea mays TaxID=4577 RepID=B4FQP7_MAIZE|nr:unknown [Zea mays]